MKNVIYIFLSVTSFLLSLVTFTYLNAEDFSNTDTKVLLIFSNLCLSVVFFELLLQKHTIRKEQKLVYYSVPFLLLEYLLIIDAFYFYKRLNTFYDHLFINLTVIVFSIFIVYYLCKMMLKVRREINESSARKRNP
jgi:small-conductance mechanosensitive channel